MIFGKQLRYLSFSAACILSGMLVNSCETEVDIQAPYEDVTLVYGLLNQQDSIHYIKINKAFLGEGDAFVYAQERDSSEYNPANVDARVEQLDDNGNVARTYPLIPDENVAKEDGVFYSPLQTVYYFVTDPNERLSSSAEYRLAINVGGENKFVSALTPLIDDNDGNYQFDGLIVGLPRVGLATVSQFTNSLAVEWVSAPGGKRYQLSFLWGYTDIYVNGNDTTQQSYTVRWPFPTMKAPNADGGDGMEVVINGEDFYKFLATQVPDFDDTPNLYRRIPDIDIDLELAIGGEQLDIFMDVAEPATGVAQEKPQYTNIDNGIGIFSCRYTLKLTDKELSKDSIEELIRGFIGGYTSEKGFCDPVTSGPLNDRPCF